MLSLRDIVPNRRKDKGIPFLILIFLPDNPAYSLRIIAATNILRGLVCNIKTKSNDLSEVPRSRNLAKATLLTCHIAMVYKWPCLDANQFGLWFSDLNYGNTGFLSLDACL